MSTMHWDEGGKLVTQLYLEKGHYSSMRVVFL